MDRRSRSVRWGAGVESGSVADDKSKRAALTEISLALAAVFWGANFAVTKYVAASVPPLLLISIRFAAGGLLMFGILRLLEPTSRLRRRDLVPMTALGVFGVSAAQIGFTFGISLTTAASTGLIFATAPIWGLLLGAMLGLERPTGRGVLGLALAVSGVGLVVLDGLGARGESLIGDLVVLGAAVFIGAYAVLSMPLLERHSPLAVATYPILLSLPILFVISSPQALSLDWGSVGLGPWAALSYSAVFATAFTFSAWQGGIRRIGANRVLVYQYLITITGVTSGIVFFGESLGFNKIAGGIVILIGVYLARRQ